MSAMRLHAHGTAFQDCTPARATCRQTAVFRHIHVCRSIIGRANRPFSGRSRAAPCRQQPLRAVVGSGTTEVTLSQPDGSTLPLEKDVFMVGSATDADLRVNWSNVEQQHAKLERKGGRVFCTALAGDEDDLLGETHTWMNGTGLRHGVAYLVAPGSTLAFGDQQQQHTLEFEEVGSASPAMEMLMKGMASGGSEEVRKQLEGV